ncbi:kinase-like protein [Leucogyrophana mollusca]|uniref:Kinase-like protein n=1 Tax=Leucogyrophana mollusca TaxID=85980 RepID=A0ACB8C1S2_9AGAM|nr:kinase-like protein [Leucogyrophana mollusca]
MPGFIKRAISRVFRTEPEHSGQPPSFITYPPRSSLTDTDSDSLSAEGVPQSKHLEKRKRTSVSPIFLLNFILRLHGVTAPVRNALIARLSGAPRVQVTPTPSPEPLGPDWDGFSPSTEASGDALPHIGHFCDSSTRSPSFDVDFVFPETTSRRRRPSESPDIRLPKVPRRLLLPGARALASDRLSSRTYGHGGPPAHGDSASRGTASRGAARLPQSDAVNRQEAARVLHYKDHTFSIRSTLGSGGFGIVWYATTETGQEVAIKVVNKVLAFDAHMPASGDPGYNHGREASDIARSIVETEFNILQRVTAAGSPFLTSLLYAFSDDDNFYFVMKFYPQTLRQRLEDRDVPLHLPQIRIWAAELVLAVQTLHDLNVIHRDLKADNILITPSGHLCVGDFGVSYEVPLEYSHEAFKSTTTSEAAGTAGYQAPEQRSSTIRDERGYGYKVDMYAAGLAIVEMCMLHGRAWYRHFDRSFEIAERSPESPGPAWTRSLVLDKAAEDLCAKLLSDDPHDRPEWEEVRQHPFFASIDWDIVAGRRYESMYQACGRNRDLAGPCAAVDHCREELGPIVWVQHKAYIDEEAQWGRGLGTLKIDYESPPHDIRRIDGHGRSCLADSRTKCNCAAPIHCQINHGRRSDTRRKNARPESEEE